MTMNRQTRRGLTTRGRGVWLGLLLAALVIGNPVRAQQAQGTENAAAPSGAALSIAKMMDPNTYFTMMTMSMDPRIWMNPISSCSACHDNEDVGRYQQVFGPFTGMMNPSTWMNPDAYNQMMASALDQKAAEHWARAVAKKYGLEPGQTPPTMHGWWPMMPMPAPAQ